MCVNWDPCSHANTSWMFLLRESPELYSIANDEYKTGDFGRRNVQDNFEWWKLNSPSRRSVESVFKKKTLIQTFVWLKYQRYKSREAHLLSSTRLLSRVWWLRVVCLHKRNAFYSWIFQLFTRVFHNCLPYPAHSYLSWKKICMNYASNIISINRLTLSRRDQDI